MKDLPIGRHEFRDIIKNDWLYVDKTPVIAQLLRGGMRWFLSRPRRFGKSLTVTTLEAIFSGEKELFKGLWLEDKINWERRPVLRFSFDSISSSVGSTRARLLHEINVMARQLGIVLEGDDLKTNLSGLIRQAAAEKPIAILVDEYDKPILDAVPDEMARANDALLVLREFFETLKTLEPFIHFLFVTGVSKFSKTGMFSGANQLNDITLDARFATLCGYTLEELKYHFSEAFPAIAQHHQIPEEHIFEEIKKWYNGYSWLGEDIYNPWSILNMVDKKRIGNYWFTSGNPSFLMRVLKKGLYYKLPNMTVTQTLLESLDLEKMEYRTLLFQAGYLTIKSENTVDRTFILGFPNYEIEESLLQSMLATYSETHPGDAGVSALQLREALHADDIGQAIKILNALFADIPHQIFLEKQEAYFHSILHIVFTMLGFYTKSEVSTSHGRIDSVVEFHDRIYIFEFKLDKSAKSALQQIQKRNYLERFAASGKKLIPIGLKFSTAKRAIVDYEPKYDTIH